MEMSLFKPLKTVSLKEEFILYMEELILNGNIKQGERLPPERELATMFGVSRPVVHEGLLILETRGLVSLRPRHGVIVNDYRIAGNLDLLLSLIKSQDGELGPKLLQDLEYFRVLMEKDIVRLICDLTGDISTDISKLIDITKEMKTAQDSHVLAELDFEFHLQLGLMCGNAIYSLLINTLKSAHMVILTKLKRCEECFVSTRKRRLI